MKRIDFYVRFHVDVLAMKHKDIQKMWAAKHTHTVYLNYHHKTYIASEFWWNQTKVIFQMRKQIA